MQWLDEVHFDDQGLVNVVTQEMGTHQVLMVAWMNREALHLTVDEGFAVYWSRSRKRLWRKGEESGHRQRVISLRLDCDADVILLEVEQMGGMACHTGRHDCFYRELSPAGDAMQHEWKIISPVIKDPSEIYRKPS
ncbi:MAG: hypothetical protein RIQ52_45 [Pseudomonadota bacterium]|jgi:phosphoribosyl-AMP cyclohydrolase